MARSSSGLWSFGHRLLWATPFLLAVAGCGLAPGQEWEGDGILAIEGATVFTSPGMPPIEDGVVIIVDGVIEAVGVRGQVRVPPNATRVLGTDLSVLPGFWNSHVRISPDILEAAAGSSAAELEYLLRDRFLRFGFTTLVETATDPQVLAPLLDRMASGEVAGPRILLAGDVDGARVHRASGDQVPWSPELLDQLLSDDVALIPAIGTFGDGVGGPAGTDAPPDLARIEEGLVLLREFVDRGGRLVFGSGAGYGDRYDPISEHLHLEDAGIPFAVRLAALTTEPADRFGDFYLGEIEPGLTADLVLLEGDPELDILAMDRVRWVLVGGRPVFPRD